MVGETYGHPQPDWGKTRRVIARLGLHEESSPRERSGKHARIIFKERHLIRRDERINGGVYPGENVREAIVVDDKKQPELASLYTGLIRKTKAMSQKTDIPLKHLLLDTVFKTVSEAMPYSEVGVEQIAREFHLQPDQKIGLNQYLIRKVGVCRHQALLAGYLLEKLVKRRHLGGKVSLDRNSVPGEGDHAWVRYTTTIGEVYILDVTNGFIGKLQDTVGNPSRWQYQRPEDRKKLH